MQICSGNMLGEFVHYKTKGVLQLLGQFVNRHQMFQGGFDDNFSGYPENWLSASHQWGVENNENLQNAQLRLAIESTSNQGQCLKSLEISKEAFYVFRRIKLGNSWKWKKFKTVMYLPLSKHFLAARSLPQNVVYFAFFPDFSHLFSDWDHFFRDPWVPLTFFPAATLVVYHIPIKICEKNNVFTQHSVNAHTKPLSEKQSLSESCGGLIRRRLFLESLHSAIEDLWLCGGFFIWLQKIWSQTIVFNPFEASNSVKD